MFPVRQCFSFISYHIILRIPFVYLALCEKVFSERFGGKQTDEKTQHQKSDHACFARNWRGLSVDLRLVVRTDVPADPGWPQQKIYDYICCLENGFATIIFYFIVGHV